jgi:hypothetical protein
MQDHGIRGKKGDAVGDQLATSATTREAQVTADSDAVYELPELDGAGYVVVPHPPTHRESNRHQR